MTINELFEYYELSKERDRCTEILCKLNGKEVSTVIFDLVNREEVAEALNDFYVKKLNRLELKLKSNGIEI